MAARKQGGDGGSVLSYVTDGPDDADAADAAQKQKKAGDVLLSHIVTHAVPSTQKSLTSEFGMGSGVASSLLSPARLKKAKEFQETS